MPSTICQVCAAPIPYGSRCQDHKTRSKSSRGGSTRRWRELRLRILRRDRYLCRYCGGEANTVDHVLPKARGGTDDPSNLVAACARCNYSKQDRTPGELAA
jgi:5-methylcytosine-specific restriction endonuclease McrA